MRLYIKLVAIILIAAAVQRFALSDAAPSELWFGLRCSYAYTMDDAQMVDRLADEARDVGYWTAHCVNAAGR